MPDELLLSLPQWALVAVVILYVLRGPIMAVIGDRVPEHFRHQATLKTDQQDFEQEVQMARLQAELRRAEAEHRAELARMSAEREEHKEREARMMTLIAEYHAWAQDVVRDDLSKLRSEQREGFERLERQLIRVSRQGRTSTQELLLNRIEQD